MKADSLGPSYLALPDGAGPFPGVVVIHEASGLNDNIRDICARFAGEGYAALGADLFEGRNREHSFFNDQWRNYEPVAAADSWQRVLAFFAEYVQSRPPSSA